MKRNMFTHLSLHSSKLVAESKFSPQPGWLVEKLIDSGVAAIVTVAVLMVVRCHQISSRAEGGRQRVQCGVAPHEKNKAVSEVRDNVPGGEESR